MLLNCQKKIKSRITEPVLNSKDAQSPWFHRNRIVTSLDLRAGIHRTNHMGCSSVTVLNIDKCLCPAQQGSGFLLAIFTKVCFFPSLHSRVYPEWFNYNFPCVRQIKEESRSVVPSTLFISLTDCSSPNPRAAAAAAAQRAHKMHGGEHKWGRESSASSQRVCRPVEITDIWS